MNIDSHHVDIDELNSSLKDALMMDKSSAAQLDDVNQRWTVLLQRVIDTKVCHYSVSLIVLCLIAVDCRAREQSLI